MSPARAAVLRALFALVLLAAAANLLIAAGVDSGRIIIR